MDIKIPYTPRRHQSYLHKEITQETKISRDTEKDAKKEIMKLVYQANRWHYLKVLAGMVRVSNESLCQPHHT